MFAALVSAAALLALTVAVHMAGMVLLFRWVLRAHVPAGARFLSTTWLLIRFVWALIAIHLLEIGVWAFFFWQRECLPDLESSFYFAAVTYATVGYGDLVLPQQWRILGPVEGLTGILMCGLSTAFFFGLVSKLMAAHKGETAG